MPAGSGAIANAQTAVYPYETPGGWSINGRTPLTVFDPAREQALASARQARVATPASAVAAAGGATLALAGPGGSDTPWWLRLSSLVPLGVLVLGLFLIDDHYTRSQIEAAAEIDAAILADDVPPDAYRDPGFAEFLKVGRR